MESVRAHEGAGTSFLKGWPIHMTETGKRIVIIGGVACGPKAAARARRCDPHAHITMIEQGEFVSFAGCGMPYYIAGAVPEKEGLMTTTTGYVRDPEYFRLMKEVTVLTGTRADRIDRENKLVHATNLKTGETSAFQYDKLVIATGARPIVPPLEGINLKGIYTLRSLEEAIEIRKTIEENMELENAVIVGGGRISLEVTDAFANQGVDATIVELLDSLLATMLDPELALYLENTLKKHGMTILTSEKVLRFEGDSDGRVAKVVTDKREIDAQMAIVAVGVRPNADLAKAAGLEIGESGGIKVNEHMQTSDPDIFAGGDCVETDNLVTGRKCLMPLGSVANRQGRVIGDNITGFSRDTYPGVVGTSMLKALDLNIGKVGLTESEASRMGYDAVSMISPGADKSHFYPGGKTLIIKLVAERASQRLLGVQVIGPGDMPRVVDTVAAALTANMTLHQLANLDVGYAPPYASAISPLAHCANALRNKINGLAESLSLPDFKKRLDTRDDYMLLDVRKENEAANATIDDPRYLMIPLHELPERMQEIPSDKKIISICQVGGRSYEAVLTLKGKGVRNACYVEGGMSAWSKTFGAGQDDGHDE
jgi:NADPH-dependent 2,4-dienoyl-CoA reductase/sulfur reductase-like enzyme/rhodanese-related sulfurtransferase